ncbi:DUF4129 domain-containing protein [Thermococcus gammatolerans]|nr:DUF4129 domain-containing protein [Thermococcus gammatolerans]
MALRLKAMILFASLVVIMALLLGPSVRAGVTAVNLDLLYLFWAIVSFSLLGYALSSIRVRGIWKRKKRSKYAVISGLLWIIAIGVAMYSLLYPTEPEWSSGNETGVPKNGPFETMRGGLTVFYKAISPYLYVVPYVLLLAIPVILYLRRRKPREVLLPEVRFDPELRYEDITGSPSEKIIRMYRNVVAGLVLKGYPYRRSWTHWEHEEKLREIFPDLEDLDTLTRLFEKAKYAERIGQKDLELAAKSYERLMEFLK